MNNSFNGKISRKKKIISVIIALLALIVLFSLSYVIEILNKEQLYVKPGESIQKAINTAFAGDEIILSEGEYNGDFHTVRSGFKDMPITIRGPKEAVIKGSSENHIFDVNHNYITIEGVTFDGLRGNSDDVNSYTDKLIYAESSKGINNLRIINVTLKNSGGESVRLRYFAHDNEIAYSNFSNSGIYNYKFNESGKNGEAIYIGTASDQWDNGKNPTSKPDESRNNWIHGNNFNTQGNECVDIKEGSENNIVENNSCTGQKDSESGGLDARGDNNIFRYNTVYGNVGAGIRLGGDTVDNKVYGKGNSVYNNMIYGNKYGAIKITVSPQGKICGNDIQKNGEGYGNFLINASKKC